MVGACPPEFAIAVANAGGMGAAGVLLDPPDPHVGGSPTADGVTRSVWRLRIFGHSGEPVE